MERTSHRAAAPATRRPPARKDRRLWIVSLMLAAAVAGVYGQTWRHGFLNFDDDIYIFKNAAVTGGLSWEGFVQAFGYLAEVWHPLTWLSHMIDFQLFGTWAGGHHLVSAGIHAANAVVLLAVLQRMTGAFWQSAVVAAIFVLHPLRVESVAWAAERKDVLFAFFWMLTLATYLRYVRKPGVGRYLATLAMFALGLAAKPMVVSLPLVLLLLDWWPLGRWGAGGASPDESGSAAGGARVSRCAPLLLEKTPFLALSLISALVTLHGKLAPLTATLPQRLANALVSSVVYLRQFFWPSDLAILYPFPRAGIPWWQTAGALVVLVLLSAVVLFARSRAPFLLVGWLWYLVTLLPVIGIVQVGTHAHADRFTYVTLLGVTIALAWLAGSLWPRTSRARAVLAAVVAAVVIALGTATAIQTNRWRDRLTLLSHAIRVTKDNYIMMNNLGSTLITAGRYEEAIPVLRDALRVKPDHCNALYNLSLALTARARAQDDPLADTRPGAVSERIARDPRRYQEALAASQRALQCFREPVDDIYFNLSRIYLALNRPPLAEWYLREVLRINPAYPGGWDALAIALSRQGKRAEAEALSPPGKLLRR